MNFDKHRGRKNITGLVAVLSASITWGVSLVENERSFSVPLVEPKVGEFYGNARARLIFSGWYPIPFKCTPQSLCFSEAPELRSTGEGDPLCGFFQKEDAFAKICVHSINDGFRVDTFRYLHQ